MTNKIFPVYANNEIDLKIYMKVLEVTVNKLAVRLRLNIIDGRKFSIRVFPGI